MKKFLYIISCFILLVVCSSSLIGCNILQGKSAYEIAVEQGFEGTVDEWLASLKGDSGSNGNGKSAYEIAVEQGFKGTVDEWLDSLKGKDSTAEGEAGKSAYEIAVENGFKGTVDEWLTSLNGKDGQDGSNGINGKNGQDGEDVSISEIFALAVEYGLYEDSAEGYAQFLNTYFGSNLNVTKDMVKEATNKGLNSAVSIYCEDYSGNLQMGAGVIYKIDTTNKYAYVVTNYHVISCIDDTGEESVYSQSKTICLYLYGTESLLTDDYGNLETYGVNAIMAEYIGGAANYDLAVLKVSGENFDKIESSSAKAVKIADSDNISLGSTAIAIGNPMGGGIAATEGVISCDSENIAISIAGATRVLRCMRISTPINPGNSGGGLFNIDGELIGICNAKRNEYVETDSYGNLIVDSYENVGFALPISNVKNVVENIIDFYETENLGEQEPEVVGVHKYLIGITITVDNPKAIYNSVENTYTLYEDIIVCDVVDGGVADNLGMLVGDKLVEITVSDGVNEDRVYSLRRNFQLFDAMLTLRTGETATIKVIRTDAETGDNQELSFEFEVSQDGYHEIIGAGV